MHGRGIRPFPPNPFDIPPFNTLGAFKNDWLDAKHHFSFGQYRDPKRPGFGRLLVWNDDRIAPGTGFDPHPHKEMEIVACEDAELVVVEVAA